MLDKRGLVNDLPQKSKTGFKERFYNDPGKVVPGMLDKSGLVNDLPQKSKTEFKERFDNDPGKVVPAMLDKTAPKKL